MQASATHVAQKPSSQYTRRRWRRKLGLNRHCNMLAGADDANCAALVTATCAQILRMHGRTRPSCNNYAGAEKVGRPNLCRQRLRTHCDDDCCTICVTQVAIPVASEVMSSASARRLRRLHRDLVVSADTHILKTVVSLLVLRPFAHLLR